VPDIQQGAHVQLKNIQVPIGTAYIILVSLLFLLKIPVLKKENLME